MLFRSSENSIGINDYAEPITLVTNAGFDAWTYKTALNKMLVAWHDLFENEEGYSIKYQIDSDSNWQVIKSDGKSGTGQRLMEYIDLNPDSEMKVCMAVIKDGYTHIYTKPITISKATDKTLIPPKDFTGTKTDYYENH